MNHSTDHRERITREEIGRKLKTDALRDIFWLLLFIPFAVLWVMCLDFVMGDVISVFYTFVWGIVLVLGGILLVGIVKTVYERVRIILAVNAGTYTVSEDILCQRVMREYPWYSRSRVYGKCKYVFSFASGKTCVNDGVRYIDTGREHYAQQFSREGDEFYVVFTDDAPERILLVYPSILFRYEDR